MRSSLRLVLAWAPLWGLWFLIAISSPGQSLAHAALDATLSIGTAALLGVAVWRLTGVYVWPEQPQFTFFGTHLVAGSLFAVLWMLPMFGAEALRRHVGLLEVARLPRVLASFAIGLWIYGLVTGVCYAVRHGIGPLASGGVVKIRSALQDASLTLEVSDTGAGASAVLAQRGRGLRLLRERLTGLYGDAATLATRTVIDQGFTATVTLPARRG